MTSSNNPNTNLNTNPNNITRAKIASNVSGNSISTNIGNTSVGLSSVTNNLTNNSIHNPTNNLTNNSVSNLTNNLVSNQIPSSPLNQKPMENKIAILDRKFKYYPPIESDKSIYRLVQLIKKPGEESRIFSIN